MTPYQKFVTADLFGIAHTAQTTKTAWNASLEQVKESVLAEGKPDISLARVLAIVEQLKEK